MTTNALSTERKFQLRDEQRSRIRWSQSKRGYVVLTDFHRGPRGGRFRSHFTVHFDFDAAFAAAEREPGRYKQAVRKVTIFEVDHLGRVTDEVAA